MANSNGYNQQAGKTDTDACSLIDTLRSEMEALPEAHGRSAEQSQPLETCAKRRRARSQSGSTSPSLIRDPFPFFSLPFIAQGGRPLSSRFSPY